MGISCFFFANDLLLVYFIFILDYGNDVRQNANSSNFLFQVQNGSSSRGNSQQHIWPRNCKWTYSAVVVQKFHKGDKSLEDEEHSGWPSEVDNNQLRAIITADPLTTIGKVAEELSVNPSIVIQHLKQTGKVKPLSKWVPRELTTNQEKNHCFQV